ncbi:MAG: hypothetical protein JKY15_04490 [Deltaproteobacteria bacterium]|nr:hypothetical protein [Deltaproteobacteria bacterium]
MDEIEIIATFDTDETAKEAAKALNTWFSWIMESDHDAEVPDMFEEFGVSADEYIIEKDEVNWEDAPVARSRSNRVTIILESANAVDALEELLEALGAYDLTVSGEED